MATTTRLDLRGTACLATAVVLFLATDILLFSRVETTGWKHRQPSLHHMDYQSHLHKPVPHNYDRWVEYAKSRQCSLDPAHYGQLYVDLKPWIQQGYIDPAAFDIVGGPANHWDGKALLGPGLSSEFENGAGGWHFMRSPFNDASILTLLDPHKPFTFFYNARDDPRSLPAPEQNGTYGTQYKHPDEAFADNACLRQRFDNANHASTGNPILDEIARNRSVRASHGYWLRPVTWHSVNAMLPFFSQDKTDCYADILVPQGYAFDSSQRNTIDPVPWEQKKDILFWRGTTTGGDFAPDAPWRQYQRTRLVKWAKDYGLKHPDRVFDYGDAGNKTVFPKPIGVDVGFSSTANNADSVKDQLTQEFGFKKFVSKADTFQFKYLIVVDGHAWPARLVDYLQFSSVILYNGIFLDWFNARLKPWVHYVPVAVDYSDLEERLEWLLTHDEEARQIAVNARTIVAKFNRYDELLCYSGLALVEYADLFYRGQERVNARSVLRSVSA